MAGELLTGFGPRLIAFKRRYAANHAKVRATTQRLPDHPRLTLSNMPRSVACIPSPTLPLSALSAGGDSGRLIALTGQA
jgi:hypothetical protein